MSENIMIVDDTPATLDLLCDIVMEGGYRARPVSSGEFALRSAVASPPDLFLLDINMPEMNGLELCARLKANPALTDIPVIFISGLTDIEEKIRAFSAGGVDYVTKPFQFEEVHSRVATHLELRRKRLELKESNDRLRELESLRDSLVHMLVHDLRSPLASLSSYLSVLNREMVSVLSPQQRDDIEQALKSAKRMVLMVNSMLDVNKLDAGKMTLRMAECDLVALVREVVGSLESLAEGRTLTIQSRSEKLFASFDSGLIFRVIQNLVANALKFTAADVGRIEVSIDRIPDGLRLQVSDNGPGIAAEHHSRIFDKFGQVGGTEVRRVFSTGLGLPFCKLAIEAHGGSIGVKSEESRGATFWFVLPEAKGVEERRSQIAASFGEREGG